MSNHRLNLQITSIFAIIIAAFFGSAMFFSYLNTDSIKQSVETETRLSSLILSSEIRSSLPETLPSTQLLDKELSDQLTEVISRANLEVGENVDVWVVDAARGVLYENVTEGGKALDELLTGAQWEELLAVIDGGDDSDASALQWVGGRGQFMLTQQLLMVRPIFENRLYLVIFNRGTSIHAMQRRQFTLFAGIEITLMTAMIVVLANTLFSYRKRLIRLATKDELTGISNRKSFHEAYLDYIKKASRKEREIFTVFLIDIDYFKQINDTFGHAAGDMALQALSSQIRRMTERCGGFAGRWGGDEFIGVVPLSGEEAYLAISQLCEDLRTTRLDEDVRITISAGAVQADRSEAPQLSHLTELADLALYASKENGRNRATLYSGELESDSPQRDKERPGAEKTTAHPAGEENRHAPSGAKAAGTGSPQGGKTAGARWKVFLREKLVASILLGVKWMAPFVAGGGLLIGLAFLFDAWSVDLASLSVSERTQLGSITTLAASLKSVGDSTFNFMLPVFAGFMAYGLAGESAFLSGFVGGFMTIESNAGFIGAMISGLVAGMIAFEINEFIGRMPRFVQKAAPIVIFPVFNLLLMHVIASLIITPVASSLGAVFSRLLDAAVQLDDGLAGAISGGMMAVDMGGIINKVSYYYGVNGLSRGGTGLMASVMAGGMVPPIGIALSMVLFKNKFTPEERERTAGTLFMGLSFITEGVLPFVFSDALRVIPSCIIGSTLAGLLSMQFGCQLPAPHGGIFVLPVMTHPFLYLIALSAGSLLTALMLGCLRKDEQTEELS